MALVVLMFLDALIYGLWMLHDQIPGLEIKFWISVGILLFSGIMLLWIRKKRNKK